MCWYCYWGWPQPVADIYRRALEGDSGALLWGPAHLIWGDCNFDRDSVQWSLDHFEIRPALAEGDAGPARRTARPRAGRLHRLEPRGLPADDGPCPGADGLRMTPERCVSEAAVRERQEKGDPSLRAGADRPTEVWGRCTPYVLHYREEA